MWGNKSIANAGELEAFQFISPHTTASTATMVSTTDLPVLSTRFLEIYSFLQREWKQHSTSEILLSTVALLFVTFVSRAVYRIWFHPLARVPGPFVAKFTHMWQTVKSFQGTWYYDILAVHEKYGPVVRISPDEISFVDGDAMKRLYGHVKPCIKAFPLKDMTDNRRHGIIRGGCRLVDMARFQFKISMNTLK